MTPELEARIKETIRTNRFFRRTLRDYISVLDIMDMYQMDANASRAEAMIAALALPVRWFHFKPVLKRQ
jgi:hypothetical protein